MRNRAIHTAGHCWYKTLQFRVWVMIRAFPKWGYPQALQVIDDHFSIETYGKAGASLKNGGGLVWRFGSNPANKWCVSAMDHVFGKMFLVYVYVYINLIHLISISISYILYVYPYLYLSIYIYICVIQIHEWKPFKTWDSKKEPNPARMHKPLLQTSSPSWSLGTGSCWWFMSMFCFPRFTYLHIETWQNR